MRAIKITRRSTFRLAYYHFSGYIYGMNICLFSADEIARGVIEARDERARHILKILHKTQGDSFSAGVVGGQAGTAFISAVVDGEIHFSFTGESDGKPLFPLDLVIGFPRPIQLKRLLRDAAGLGARSVHLTATELGEKSYLESNIVKDGGAQRMLLDGTAQAASTHVPALFVHNSLDECLSVLAEKSDSLKIALDNVGAEKSLIALFPAIQSAASVTAAIGSERGWSENERRILESAGYARCSMGTRVLRTETAATTAMSLILGAMGFLG